jgi:hypothetical protein
VDLGCGEIDCFGVYWGAVLALNLNQTGPLDEMSNPTAIAWNADGNGVSGFSFNLTNGDGANGNFGGAVVRLGVRVDGDPGIYCAYLAPGQNSIDFDEIYENCWQPDADLFNAVPDSSMLTVVEWQILGDQNDAYDYNFCVEDIFGN